MELGMGLVCPEPCFQAESAGECLLRLRNGPELSKFSSLSSVIEILCREEIALDDWCLLSHLGVLNSFVTISGMLLFQIG